VEDTLHGELLGVVVGVEWFGFVRAARGAKGRGSREQGFDGLVAENNERSHRPEAARKGFIASRAADAGDDVLGAQLFRS
jgi:hypothetical protein